MPENAVLGVSINFTPVADGQHIYYIRCHIKRVDDPIISNAQAVTIAASKMMVREAGKP